MYCYVAWESHIRLIVDWSQLWLTATSASHSDSEPVIHTHLWLWCRAGQIALMLCTVGPGRKSWLMIMVFHIPQNF